MWAYCRVSTALEAQEVSLDDQEAWARSYAAEKQQPIRVFREQASAKTTVGRPIFQAMMAEMQGLPASARPRLLLVTRFDRLSRDMTDTLLVVRTLKSMRVGLYTRDSGLVPADTFAHRAAIVGQSMGGEAENEARSNRMKASIERRRREGKATSPKAPYGIQMRGGFDTPNGEAAEWVRKAFSWYAEGLGLHPIAERLREGAPDHSIESVEVDSATGHPKVRTRPITWERTMVAKMLRQPRYRDVVVPAALWDRVQEVRAGKPRWRTDRKYEYPLSGIVRCPNCGRPLSAYSTGSAQRVNRTRYYYCRVSREAFNAERVEAAFRERCQAFIADERALREWMDAGTDQGDREREVTRLERAIAGAEQAKAGAWDLALKASIPADDLAAQLRRIEDEATANRVRLAEARAALSRAQMQRRTADEAHALLATFWERYDRATHEQRKLLMAAAAEAVGPVYATKDGIDTRARIKDDDDG